VPGVIPAEAEIQILFEFLDKRVALAIRRLPGMTTEFM
jgi:hypothetical protein